MHEDREIEILLKYYEAARTNVITRLAARDNSILLYLGGVAALAAAAFSGNKQSYDILLLIPFFSSGVAAFTAQHNYVMDSLYLYIACNIHRRLKELNYNLTPWELSEQYTSGRRFSTGTRNIAEIIIILIPAVFSIVIYAFYIYEKHEELDFRWYKVALYFICVLAALHAVRILWRAYAKGKKHIVDIKDVRDTIWANQE